MTHRWAAVVLFLKCILHFIKMRIEEKKTETFTHINTNTLDWNFLMDWVFKIHTKQSLKYMQSIFFCNSKSIFPVLNVWDFSFLFLLKSISTTEHFFFFLTFDGFYFSLCVHITYNSYNVTLIHNFDFMQHFYWINCWMHTQINRNCVGRKSTNKKSLWI